MSEPYSINIHDLPAVANVCNQILREAIKLKDVSIAHVRMNPNDISLLHSHKKLTEIYYILNGEGTMYYGNKAISAGKNYSLIIPPDIPHKLRNLNGGFLEHLVFSVPPFDNEDIRLLDEKSDVTPIENLKKDSKPIISMDGALVHELLSKEEQSKLGIELAYGILEPQKKATRHMHKISEEVYYIISGEGKAVVGDKAFDARQDIIIYVPTDTFHGLENQSSEKLEVLCLSSPPYTDEDFIIER